VARLALLDTGQGAPARDELAHLVTRNDQLEAENRALRCDRERLRARVARLERKVEELRRKTKRQAAPFSRERRERNPGRGGRRPGTAYGRRRRRPAPEERCSVRGCPTAVSAAGHLGSPTLEAAGAATRAVISSRPPMPSARPPRCSAPLRSRSQPSSTGAQALPEMELPTFLRAVRDLDHPGRRRRRDRARGDHGWLASGRAGERGDRGPAGASGPADRKRRAARRLHRRSLRQAGPRGGLHPAIALPFAGGQQAIARRCQ
jgi:hypothetical protein